MHRRTILTVAGFLLFVLPISSQSASTSGQNPKPIPIEHLYLHFLLYQHHLDNSAAARQKEGKNGEWLRSSLRKRLHFTEDDFAPVRAAAERLSAEITDLNTRAKAIIAADRSARSQGLIPPGSPPPGLAKLKALSAERDADFQAEIAALNQALSPANADALRTFLTTEFVKSVQRGTLAPGQRGAWHSSLLPKKGTRP